VVGDEAMRMKRKMAERDRANPTPQQPNLLQNTNTTNSQALAERSVQEKKAKREEEEKKTNSFFKGRVE
jgi:hypothetical protein